MTLAMTTGKSHQRRHGRDQPCLRHLGARLANQDTDAVRFLFSSGNIASGTIRMYGIT